MSELQVRIVNLEPLRLAGASGFGPEPEGQAWDTLLEWAGRHNLLSRPHRFFGYNNPDPSPGSPNYGYDQWITVGPEIQAEGAIKLKELPRGLYAVARCNNVQNIPPTWKQLVVWCEASKYHMAHHQWLEECLTPMMPGSLPVEQMQFDLYLPIVE